MIVEGSEFFTNCQVLAGNPEALTTQYWEFEPKYDGTQSQALPMQRENRDLTINRTLYSDAGTYRCIAGNTVGVDTGEIQIVVQCEYEVSLLFYRTNLCNDARMY